MVEEEEGNKRNIVYICDKNYLLPTIVSVQSLLENISPSEKFHYTVHICALSITPEDQKRLCGMKNEKAEVCIHNVDRQKYLKLYEKIQQKTYVTMTALLKFELSEILPDIDEVLYLDSDVIINQSVAQFFEYDVSQYALAAVFDLVFYLAGPHDRDPEALPKEFYFNSGVMLMNLKEFRRRNIPELLWETKFALADSPKNTMNLMDQNAFNEVLSRNCLPLPIRYNCPNQYVANMETNIERINYLYGTKYRDTIDLGEDAVIIHYIGRKSKPWLYNSCAWRDIWDRYCRHAGIDPDKLNRHSGSEQENKNFKYYIHKGLTLLKTKGIRETCQYLWYRMRLKMAGR